MSVCSLDGRAKAVDNTSLYREGIKMAADLLASFAWRHFGRRRWCYPDQIQFDLSLEDRESCDGWYHRYSRLSRGEIA